jgi:acyl carrier protein
MQTLVEEIKTLIIESLNLEDITAADIDTDAPLFGEGLGLDSIDALEIGIALQKRYGVHLAPDAAETRAHFRSVASLAELVAANRSR